MQHFMIYGDKVSGNCLKVKYVAEMLELEHTWVDVDVVAGGVRTPEMTAKNPARQVPFIELEDGRVLSQSNAIMRFLAEGSFLVPSDAFESAQMDQWLFWEQYSHETAIAVARFKMRFLGIAASDLDPVLVNKGNAALDMMEEHLEGREWFVGAKVSLADIALVAYTQFADEGGFSLISRPRVQAWVYRVLDAIADARHKH